MQYNAVRSRGLLQALRGRVLVWEGDMRKKNYAHLIHGAVILAAVVLSACVVTRQERAAQVQSVWVYAVEDGVNHILSFYKDGTFVLEQVRTAGDAQNRAAMLRGLYTGRAGTDSVIEFTAVMQCIVPGDPDSPWVDVTEQFAAEGLLTGIYANGELIVLGGTPFTEQ